MMKGFLMFGGSLRGMKRLS